MIDGLCEAGVHRAMILVCGRDTADEKSVINAPRTPSGAREMTDNGRSVKGGCGIGHTRPRATHGEPSGCQCTSSFFEGPRIAVVHNGIIENYEQA